MSQNFNLEDFCGLREYGTSTDGTGGEIKVKPEDFKVVEIPKERKDGDKFLLCDLEKKNMTTFQAVSKVASALGISKDRIGFAGLKDRRALTKQRISIKDVDEEGLEEVGSGDFELTPIGSSSEPVKAGDLDGNGFVITVRNIDLSEKECRKRVKSTVKEASEKGIPNYFGLQRFGGNRPVSHLVGRELLGRNFKKAIMTYLTRTFPSERKEFRKARRKLQEEGDYSEALGYFPRSLDYERKLLEKISKKDPSGKEDWLKLLKIFPKNLRRIFVHAYQSYLFNLSLSRILDKRDEVKNFPAKLVGYSTRLSDSKFDRAIKEQLEEDGVKPEDFRFKEMSELSSEGDIRAALIETEISIKEISEDDLNSGKRKVTVEFSLKPGSYATVVLRKISKKYGK